MLSCNALHDAIAIYPDIDNVCWDTDSEEIQESAIAQLRYIIDCLFELASPLDDEREKLENLGIGQLTVSYKELILDRFPNTPEYLVSRLALGSRLCHEWVRAPQERKIIAPSVPNITIDSIHGSAQRTTTATLITTDNRPAVLSENRTHAYTVATSANDSGYSSMQLSVVQPAASVAESVISTYSLLGGQTRLPSRPNPANGYLCVLCSEPQIPKSRTGLSKGRWR